MLTQKCSKRNRSGNPCGAPAGANGLCAIHADPERARELGAKGGRGNRRETNNAPEAELGPPQNAVEVRVALGRIMADVHNGRLETRRATTAVYAAMAFIKALETSDLEKRLAALEEKADGKCKKQG